MKITLLAMTQPVAPLRDVYPEAREDQLVGTPQEQLIEAAGRTCYDSMGKGRPSGEYHAHLLDAEHGSVLEHVTFTWRIEGVSRNLTHELIRHRVGTAISQRSTRYCDEGGAKVVRHPAEVKYCEGPGIEPGIEILLDQLLYMVPLKQRRAAAARYLPHGIETELVWSCNVRTLRTILDQRASDAADAEFRQLAVMLWRSALPHVPRYLDEYREQPAADGLGNILVRPTSRASLERRIKELEAALADADLRPDC